MIELIDMHRFIYKKNTDIIFYHFIKERGENGEISRKALRLSLFLSIVSISCILFGLVEEWRRWDPSEGLAFLILGMISGIPGFYVMYILRCAWKAEPESI